MKDRYKKLRKLFLRFKVFLFLLLFSLALASCSSGSSEAKSPAEVAIELANLYQAEGDSESAISVLESYMAEYSKTSDARVNYNLAALYYSYEREDEALELCKESFSNFPGHLRFLDLELKIYQKREDRENERKILESLLDLKSLDNDQVELLYSLLSEEEKKTELGDKLSQAIVKSSSLWTKESLRIALEIYQLQEKEKEVEEINKIINYAKEYKTEEEGK